MFGRPSLRPWFANERLYEASCFVRLKQFFHLSFGADFRTEINKTNQRSAGNRREHANLWGSFRLL